MKNSLFGVTILATALLAVQSFAHAVTMGAITYRNETNTPMFANLSDSSVTGGALLDPGAVVSEALPNPVPYERIWIGLGSGGVTYGEFIGAVDSRLPVVAHITRSSASQSEELDRLHLLRLVTPPNA